MLLFNVPEAFGAVTLHLHEREITTLRTSSFEAEVQSTTDGRGLRMDKIVIRKPGQTGERVVDMSEFSLRADKLVSFGSLLIALGNFKHGQFISIIDSDTGTIEKTVKGFWPYASPDGRYIAYEEFIPRFAPVEYCVPSLRIMDVASEGFPTYQVYPLGLLENKENDGRVHNTVSPVLWMPDNRGIVFFDKLSLYGEWEGHESFVVYIDLSKGLSAPRALRKQLNPYDYFDETKALGTDREPRIVVVEMDWLDEKRISATYHYKSTWKINPVVFDLVEMGLLPVAETPNPGSK